jgi:hypothetical protein
MRFADLGVLFEDMSLYYILLVNLECSLLLAAMNHPKAGRFWDPIWLKWLNCIGGRLIPNLFWLSWLHTEYLQSYSRWTSITATMALRNNNVVHFHSYSSREKVNVLWFWEGINMQSYRQWVILSIIALKLKINWIIVKHMLLALPALSKHFTRKTTLCLNLNINVLFDGDFLSLHNHIVIEKKQAPHQSRSNKQFLLITESQRDLYEIMFSHKINSII